MAAKKDRRPLYERIGHALLFASYIALLAGKFSLDRISSSLPAIDLRLVAIYALALGWILWYAVARLHLRGTLPKAGIGLFVVWAAWMAASAAWAPPDARIGDYLLDLALMVGFLLFAIHLAATLPGDVTARIWTWVFWAGVLYFLGAMLEGPGEQGRYSAFGGGPNVFVRIMVLGAIAALYLSVTRNRTLPLLAIPAFAVGAALSGSRGGLLSAAIVVAMFVIPIIRQLGAKRTAGFTVVGTIGAAVALNLNNGAIWNFIEDRYIQQTLVEGYTSGRASITEQIITLWAQNPIGGVGLDGYYASQSGGGFEYPHNLFLASAGEGGTIGAALLVLAILAFVLPTLRTRPIPTAAMTSLLAAAYLFLASMFSGDYYDSRFMWFFLAIAAIEAGRRSTARPPVALRSRRRVRGRPISV